MGVVEKIKVMSKSQRGRMVLAGGAAAVVAVVVLARRGSDAGADAGSGEGVPAAAYAPAGVPVPDGGYGISEGGNYAQTEQLEIVHGDLADLADRLDYFGQNLYDLQVNIEQQATGQDAPAPAAAPLPAAPKPNVQAPAPSSASRLPGFTRNQGLWEWVNEQGNRERAKPSLKQREAYAAAYRKAKAKNGGVNYEIPGLAGTYNVNPQGNTVRVA